MEAVAILKARHQTYLQARETNPYRPFGTYFIFPPSPWQSSPTGYRHTDTTPQKGQKPGSFPGRFGFPVFLARSLAQQRLEILEHQKQVERIGRAFFEVKFPVPLPSLIILGMDKHSADTGNVRRQQSASQRILE